MINDIHFKGNPLQLIEEYGLLGKRINKFIQYVEINWKTNKNKPAPATSFRTFNFTNFTNFINFLLYKLSTL
jgi:hypothetical protein